MKSRKFLGRLALSEVVCDEAELAADESTPASKFMCVMGAPGMFLCLRDKVKRLACSSFDSHAKTQLMLEQ